MADEIESLHNLYMLNSGIL